MAMRPEPTPTPCQRLAGRPRPRTRLLHRKATRPRAKETPSAAWARCASSRTGARRTKARSLAPFRWVASFYWRRSRRPRLPTPPTRQIAMYRRRRLPTRPARERRRKGEKRRARLGAAVGRAGGERPPRNGARRPMRPTTVTCAVAMTSHGAGPGKARRRHRRSRNASRHVRPPRWQRCPLTSVIEANALKRDIADRAATSAPRSCPRKRVVRLSQLGTDRRLHRWQCGPYTVASTPFPSADRLII